MFVDACTSSVKWPQENRNGSLPSLSNARRACSSLPVMSCVTTEHLPRPTSSRQRWRRPSRRSNSSPRRWPRYLATTSVTSSDKSGTRSSCSPRAPGFTRWTTLLDGVAAARPFYLVFVWSSSWTGNHYSTESQQLMAVWTTKSDSLF